MSKKVYLIPSASIISLNNLCWPKRFYIQCSLLSPSPSKHF